jgi:hypothetical protein
MKFIKYSLIALLVGFIGLNIHNEFKHNAYADVASLTPTAPTKSSIDVFNIGGVTSGVNWQQMVYQTVASINWTAINFSNNNVNWSQLYLPTAP